MSQEEIEAAIELLPGRLYYMAVTHLPKDTNLSHFFCTDEVLRYYNYFLDFGPMSICQIHRFCTVLELKMNSRKFLGKRIYYYSRQNPKLKINSIHLICCYLVTKQQFTVDRAFSFFEGIDLPFYHDASPYDCDFKLTAKHCLSGLIKAINMNLVNWNDFNYDDYEKYERMENGDMNWVVKDRIIAFSGPHDITDEVNGIKTFTPEDYLPAFRTLNVGVVVRLNKPAYDARRFVRNGIKHYDIYFPDGGLPEFSQLLRFIAIVKKHDKAIAVHCKAGLGRTGTVVCAYLISQHGMTAEEAIGFCRICRPGSVVGCQQHFLKRIEQRLRETTEEEIFASFTSRRNSMYENYSFINNRSHRSSFSPSPLRRDSDAKPLITKQRESVTTDEDRDASTHDVIDQGSSLYNRKVINTSNQSTIKEIVESKDVSPNETVKRYTVFLICLIISSVIYAVITYSPHSIFSSIIVCVISTLILFKTAIKQFFYTAGVEK